MGSSLEKVEGRRKVEGVVYEYGGYLVFLVSCLVMSIVERFIVIGRNLWIIKNCLFFYVINDKIVIKCNGCFFRVIVVNIFDYYFKCLVLN